MKIIAARPNEEVDITYGIHETPYGTCFIATTEKGICSLAFCTKKETKSLLENLKGQWKKATCTLNEAFTKRIVNNIFGKSKKEKYTLHIFGTDFQIRVWKVLDKVPSGKTTTYSEIAKKVGSPRAVRAVGSAVGANNIAYLIPCHRVVRSDGALGGYRWGGEKRKAAILADEKH